MEPEEELAEAQVEAQEVVEELLEAAAYLVEQLKVPQ